MCKLNEHKCYCGVVYFCNDEDFVCPTLNEDEEANLCPECLDREHQKLLEWYYGEDAPTETR